MPPQKYYRETNEGIILAVKVIPKAGKSEIIGEEEGELKLRIAAVPEKGKANEEVIRLLSKDFKIPKSRITILSGEKSRHKKILLDCTADSLVKNLIF